ncbi:MAG: TonB-dependent receptor domain-containing protein, partial [Sphingobacterium sp.]
TDLIRRRWLDNHFYGLTYSLLYRPSAALNFTFGGAYNQYKGDHYGEVIWARFASDSEINQSYYVNESTKNDFNFFAKADYRIAKWLFNVDVQYRNIHYYGKGDDDKIKDLDFQDKLNFINPKLGITYFINATQNLYLSYALASKEPTRNDYVENPRNEFPKPESMQNIEAGYRINTEEYSFAANVYGMFYNNQLIPTGAINDVGSALRINVKDSYRAGIELDGSWKINDHFNWGLNAALSQNKIKNFTEEIPEYDQDWSYLGTVKITHASTTIAKSPSTILGNTFTYKPTQQLSMSLMSKYISRIYLDNSSDTNRSIDPSFVHNFQAIYSFSLWGIKNMELNLLVNNLLNAKYATSGYTWSQKFEKEQQSKYYNFYYPQAETNAMLGLNIRF